MPDSFLDALPKLIAADADAARAEGEAALNEAKAAHELALADGDEARAESIWEALDLMRHDFANLDAECRRDLAFAAELSRKAHAASMLLQGVPIAAFSHAVDSYRYFAKQAVLEDGSGPLFDSPVTFSRIDGAQFFVNEAPDEPCFVPQESAANPLTLIDWALHNHCLPRQGTPACQVFVTAFRAIAAVFRADIEAANARAAAARAAVFGAWKPATLLAAPSPAAKGPAADSGPRGGTDAAPD